MAKLGAVTGFYTERVQLTAANGFEAGKCYAVRVEAVMGGVTAAAAHSFAVKVASANVTMWAGVAVAAADANGNVLAKLADGVQHGGVTATMHMRKLAIDNSLADEPTLEISGSGVNNTALVISGTNADAIYVSAGSGYAMRVSSQNGILHDAPVAMDIEGYVAELGATPRPARAVQKRQPNGLVFSDLVLSFERD